MIANMSLLYVRNAPIPMKKLLGQQYLMQVNVDNENNDGLANYL